MPLRDHFRPPLDDESAWDAVHGAWPTMIMVDLNRRLPAGFVAEPRVHLGGTFEVDVAAVESRRPRWRGTPAGDEEDGGVATAVWAPPRPTLTVATDPPDQDAYEVLVFDRARPRRLVAAVEIVSPANKDRPDHRRAFVAKCATLLQQRICVSIVDVVTVRQFNLYADLLDLIGRADPALGPEPAPTYAATCRWREAGAPAAARPTGDLAWQFEAWAHQLALGQSLPTLPLWLSPDLAVPLELEATYEETCRALRLT